MTRRRWYLVGGLVAVVLVALVAVGAWAWSGYKASKLSDAASWAQGLGLLGSIIDDSTDFGAWLRDRLGIGSKDNGDATD